MQSHAGPSRRAGADYQSDFSPNKVLLIAYPPVSCEQKINRRFLRGVEQRAVGKPIPPLGLRRNDRVPGKRAAEPFGRPVVKENEHLRAQRAAALAGKL